MVPLYVSNGIAYVWNAEDWYSLRTKHRICGALIGCIPSFPRQNDFQGLPMELMSEEATLLVEKGICELIELPKLIEKPSEKLKNEIQTIEDKIVNEQSEALKKRKIEQLSQKIDIIVAGKRQKLLSKGITDVDLDKKVLLQEEINKLSTVSSAYLLVHLPTEHVLNSEKKKVNVEDLIPSVVDIQGAKRLAIFKDLWEKGYYITSGSKFGSDYLIYPGDPVKFHAMYMLRCVSDQSTNFRPINLISFGRLAVAVNKMAVLASYNNYGRIDYQTVQWHDSIN